MRVIDSSHKNTPEDDFLKMIQISYIDTYSGKENVYLSKNRLKVRLHIASGNSSSNASGNTSGKQGINRV
jgi:hypothetical protein